MKTAPETYDREFRCFQLLEQVYAGGGYSTIALDHALRDILPEARGFITRVFYGVLSKDVQYDYIIGKAAATRPKRSIRTLIKMGLYLLRESETPDYAVVNMIVQLCERAGKRQLKGFVNAVLRASKDIGLPDKKPDLALYLSVLYSVPRWIIERLIAEKGAEFTEQYYKAVLDNRPHVRINGLLKHTDDLIRQIPDATPTATGFYAGYTALKKLDESTYTVQSLASTLAVRYFTQDFPKGGTLLDLCAAPGGKAVYFHERTGAAVTACDIHPHRVQLINSYAARMQAPITVLQNDATVRNPAFVGKFDGVLCDVPCSGLGVSHRKPDIFLHKTAADIDALTKLQASILETAASYVAVEGQLFYSTCTVLRAENEDAVHTFLAAHPDFALVPGEGADADGFYRVYPHTHGCDGFFAAKLLRTAKG